jgi:hypothetical protein
LELSSGRLEQMLQGNHKPVLLSMKDKQFEYWVFESVGGVTMAFACAE